MNTLANNPWQALMAASAAPAREAAPQPRPLPRHTSWYGRPVIGTPREWSGDTTRYRRLPLSQVQHDCLMSLRYGFEVHEVGNAEEAALLLRGKRSLGYTLVTLRSLLKLGLIRQARNKGYEITDYGLFLLCFFKLRS